MSKAAWYHDPACSNCTEEQCLPSELRLKSSVWQTGFTALEALLRRHTSSPSLPPAPVEITKATPPTKSGSEQVVFWFLSGLEIVLCPFPQRKHLILTHLTWTIMCYRGRPADNTQTNKPSYPSQSCSLSHPQGAVLREDLVWVAHCSCYSRFSTKLCRYYHFSFIGILQDSHNTQKI